MVLTPAGRRAGGNTALTDNAGPVAPKPGLAARQAAAKLLAAVVDRKISLDGLLDPGNGNPAFRALSEADRALVRAILVVSLRHLPAIEALLAAMMDKPLPEGARALHHAMVVAAAQMLYLDVPDRAAVDLAVEQAHADPRARRFASLVNAVLRRLSREKDERLGAASSVIMAPDWYAQRLFAAYGETRGRAILDMHRHEAPIDLTVKSDPAGWAARLGGIVLATGSVRLDDFSGSVAALDGYDEGAWWVQDAAASIPARLFGAIDGLVVADLCAAPGGKTAQLAMQGAVVTAFDQSANRLKRLETNLARLKLDVGCVHADFMTLAPEGRFDAVLLDAPCSSTGTVRRHPDVPWTKGPQDVAKLATLQGRMLRHALALVKPGGVVVFSNCSLDRAEGEDIVAEILAEMPGVTRRPVDPADWPGLEEAVTAEGDLRTTPEMLPAAAARQAGLDGFFASVLVRST